MLLTGGTLTLGQKVTLRALVEQFGTAVMPVRVAIRRLTAAGALTIQPNRTICVNSPIRKALAEMVRTRCALEALATETACLEIADSQIEKMQALGERCQRLGGRLKPNANLLGRANRELHFGVYRAARMPQITGLIEELWIQVGPVPSMDKRLGARGLTRREAINQHARLIEKLHSRDPVRGRPAAVADSRQTAHYILRSGFLEQLQRQSSAHPSRHRTGVHRP